jgi:hypothetical protein
LRNEPVSFPGARSNSSSSHPVMPPTMILTGLRSRARRKAARCAPLQ